MLNDFRAIFGTYTPLTDVNGNVLPNYEYIFMYIIFAIVLYWFLKFLFSLFKK